MTETRIDGKEALIKKLALLPDRVQVKVKAATLKGAEIVADDARSRVPVASGELRNSIKARRSEKNEFGAVVGSDKFYIRFIEFGTQKMPAKPFLFPALKANKKQVMSGVRRSVTAALKHLAVNK